MRNLQSRIKTLERLARDIKEPKEEIYDFAKLSLEELLELERYKEKIIELGGNLELLDLLSLERLDFLLQKASSVE